MFKRFPLLLLLCLTIVAFSQERTEVNFPDIPGYITLKGDFHMHTPFSDGTVWPSDRVIEAWHSGLDVIAITDHLEYDSYSDDVKVDKNRPYEIALPVAEEYGMLLIQAGEITRSMPPGHFNAFFLNDVNALIQEDFMDAFTEAEKQNAFIIWNHPGWDTQQADSTMWFPIHTQLYERGLIRGIEIANEKEFYPIVQKWAKEKKLTLFGNSDIHGFVSHLWDIDEGEHRPMTLVFVKEKTVKGVRDAFESQKTVAYYNNLLIGDEILLEPLFKNSFKIINNNNCLNEQNEINLMVNNTSSVDFELEALESNDFDFPQNIKLSAGKTVLLKIKCKNHKTGNNLFKLPYRVKNLITAPNNSLETTLDFNALSFNMIEIITQEDGSYMFNPEAFQNKSRSLFYTTDGTQPSEASNKSHEAFNASTPITLKYIVYSKGISTGKTYSKQFIGNKASGSKVTLKNKPVEKYSAFGANTLVDGVLGSSYYGDGNWLGFKGEDVDLTVSFKQAKNIQEISLNFLEDHNSWIFQASSIEISVSTDGQHYKTIKHKKIKSPKKESEKRTVNVSAKTKIKNVISIKVKAKAIDALPDWHSGSGEKAWIFVDELIVK